MSTARGPVVGFGELLLRLKSPGPTRLLQENQLEAVFGGAEFNVLACLSRWGLATEYVSVLPENPLGTAALEEISRHGIGTRHLVRLSSRMGLYFLESGADLRSGSVVYDRDGSAFARLAAKDFDWPEILKGCGWLHVTGITAALGDQPRAALNSAMSAGRALGLEVSLDVNLRPSLWVRSETTPREALAPLLRHASVIFAGIDDWSACFDGAAPQEQRETATRRFLERMLEAYPSSKAIISSLRDSSGADEHKLSASAIVRGEGFVQARTVHIRNIVDRIGAGDAMVAGCIWNLLQSSPWQRTLDFGVMAGALKHTVPGDVSRISCEEIEAALAGADGGRLRR